MKHFFTLCVIVLIIACGKKEETTQETLPTYEIKTYRLESAGGCKSDTTKCASYEVEYPEFKLPSQAANDSLKMKIALSIDTGNPEADNLSFEVTGKKFLQDYEKTIKAFPESAMGWYFKASVNINLLTDTLISLESTSEYFTGGAHSGYGTYFININPHTGSTIKLNHILNGGYEESLRLIAEKEFRKSLEFTDTTSFAEEGFEFADDRFKLNDNYGFTKEGIVFVFNIYEIGPYVLGAQEVLIPYEEIKGWLK